MQASKKQAALIIFVLAPHHGQYERPPIVGYDMDLRAVYFLQRVARQYILRCAFGKQLTAFQQHDLVTVGKREV